MCTDDDDEDDDDDGGYDDDEEERTGSMYGVSRGSSIGWMGVKSVTRTCWAAQECPAMTRGPLERAALMEMKAKPPANGSKVG